MTAFDCSQDDVYYKNNKKAFDGSLKTAKNENGVDIGNTVVYSSPQGVSMNVGPNLSEFHVTLSPSFKIIITIDQTTKSKQVKLFNDSQLVFSQNL